MQIKQRYIFGLLFLILFAVWLAVFSLPDDKLHLIACDVGEGDAFLATYGNIQVLTDGGPNSRVLDCLAKYLPFWDRKIELVILTHPDKDHSAGLIEVFRRYQVDNFLYNGQVSGSQIYGVLEKEVGGKGVRKQVAAQGTKVRVGKIYLDILHPAGGEQAGEDNAYSIVSLLSFGNFKALLTGDMTSEVSDSLAVSQLALSANRRVQYLKVPHHGSKNGLTENLLSATQPKVAVISVGKNSYGHPHEETLKILRNYDIKILRTDEVGDVEVVSDGEKYWIEE